ncbi:probable receptor-like serine/threonine-protein kinase At4g34500 [Elaeis guineensis]|uniref:non-specific serine/threonine protein kinase n=2 Tax=Elaeis guineensis var. tenera TaxID=51953 RepID=A0A6I9S869_ELAGV|nr:probable receptor-like serine/threonine-protein kinase At4g34500 [Elaeis guineensis]XP_010939279.1 probable receptor-like serine/threonine-protein kinase At4g34500 [Elaeis guineensis]XP_019710658.1 probable receptor-like serine/threonine-protein kinase At4g34500 [Elaeis guineensis]
MGAGNLTSGGFFAEKTAVLDLPVYILVAIATALLLVGAIFAFLFFRRRAAASRVKHTSVIIPSSTKEISVDRVAEGGVGEVEVEVEVEVEEKKKGLVGVNKGERLLGSSSGASSSEAAERMGNIGWGRWYSLVELEAATGAFSAGNVIGEGGYGVVYKGVLPDLSIVAVKNLLNNKGQAEKEFKVEVEAIGKVRHKNLVGLVGYCAEGAKRMLVYEYIDNGNLERWLHGDVGPVSPLTWDIRIKIAIGTAKGIAYLHEGLEPKVVHRDIKSSNILLDKHWNAKVSDFGLAKLLGSGSSFVTTRVMGTFGYVAPEYACTGMLNESSDVYSFGVLLMEIISGRCPVDYSRPPGEVNLVDWFKGMVGSRRGEEVVDPLMEVQPSPRALKRVLLVCLRCVDLDAQKRPNMGQIVHMLEGDEFPFRMEHRLTRERMLDASNAPTKRIPLLSEKVIAADSERSMWR